MVNPFTADMVPIQIRVKRSSQLDMELENINNKLLILDVHMSWYDAFFENFRIRVDPQKFSVQRVTNEGPPKHNLREQIKVLMGEFKKPQDKFTVHLVENKKFQRKSECGPPRLSPAEPNNGVLRYVQNHRHVTRPPSPPQGNASRINNSSRLGAGGIATSKRPAENLPPRRGQQYYEEDGFDQVPRNSKTNFSGYRHTPVNAYDINDDDNEDARSNITSASQDSQIEDLKILGIRYEDVKGPFYKRAKHTVSNTQYLMAKHELELMKKNNNSRWSKWTTAVPITANIIRDLLDV